MPLDYGEIRLASCAEGRACERTSPVPGPRLRGKPIVAVTDIGVGLRRAGEHPGADPGLDCGYPSASQPVADTGDRTSAPTGAISVAWTQTPRTVTCSFERERNSHVQANHRSRTR